MDYALEQMRERYEALPADVRSAMDSIEIADKIQSLGEKYKIHIDKVEELMDETSMVMLGLTHPKDYLGNLKSRLEIPEDLAREIVGEVNEQIFKPIRESLRKIHNISRDEKIDEREIPTTGDILTQPTAAPSEISDEQTLKQEDNLQPTQLEADIGPSGLDKVEEKILADAGIEIGKPELQDTNNELQKEVSSPKRSEILGAIENPSAVLKGEVTMPAGFILTRDIPSGASVVASLQQKSGSVGNTPTIEKTAGSPNQPQKEPVMPDKKYEVDPYREPTS